MYRKTFKKVESNLLSLVIDWPWMSKLISLQEIPIMKVFIHRLQTFLRILSIFAESFVCMCVPVIKLFFSQPNPFYNLLGKAGSGSL